MNAQGKGTGGLVLDVLDDVISVGPSIAADVLESLHGDRGPGSPLSEEQLVHDHPLAEADDDLRTGLLALEGGIELRPRDTRSQALS